MKKYLLIILIVLALLPFVIPNEYYLNILVHFAIFALFAVSLNLVVGYIGVISFGHAAYFGLGAYFSTIITQELGVSFWISIIITLVLTGFIGMVVGLLSLRLQGVHFAIITLAFAEVFRLIILNLSDITRGAMGISISSPTIPFTEITLTQSTIYFYLVFAILIIVLLLKKQLLDTPFGKGIIAIREESTLASSIGINVIKYKVITFTISSVIAAMAGILYAPFVGIITPDLLSVHYTTEALLMVVVGGMGVLFGPLIGAFIFTVIPELLWMEPPVQLLVFGVILVLSILFMPKGIASILPKYIKVNQSKKDRQLTRKLKES